MIKLNTGMCFGFEEEKQSKNEKRLYISSLPAYFGNLFKSNYIIIIKKLKHK